MEGKRDSPFCVAQTTLRTSTQPAHLLVKSPECGRADYHIRGLPLRSCRRRSHRREPSPVVWKVRKVQRKGFLSMWPRCPCIPAIDRRQFFGGGQLRKLRNIIRSPKRAWVPCQIVRLDTHLNLANNATFWRCSACHG